MYQAPDYEKISTKVEDVYKTYGCYMRSTTTSRYVDAAGGVGTKCEDTFLKDVTETFAELYPETIYQCYNGDKPTL